MIVDIPPLVKTNNYVIVNRKIRNLSEQLNSLIIFELILGMNRAYLSRCPKYFRILSYMYSIILNVILLYYSFFVLIDKNIHTSIAKFSMMISNTACVLYVMIFNKNSLKKYFKILVEIDMILNIQKNYNITSYFNKSVLVFLSIIYILMFFFICLFDRCTENNNKSHAIPLFVANLVLDLEYLFYGCLLKFIYTRAVILRAHVNKLYPSNGKGRDNNMIILANKCSLDVGTLRRVYEKLHECSSAANDIIRIPMLINIYLSGLHITLLIFIGIKVMRSTDIRYPYLNGMFVLIRISLSSLLLLLQCYYAGQTTVQVSSMRSVLHDAVLFETKDKNERRLVKIFYRAVKEYSIEYSLCGVVTLNMALPLNTLNICFTYLLIMIQFSKFLQ